MTFDPNRDADNDDVIDSERATALLAQRKAWTQRRSIPFDPSGTFARWMQDAPDQLFTERINKITGSPVLLTHAEKDADARKRLNNALFLVHAIRATVGFRTITLAEAEASIAYKRLRNAADQEAVLYVIESQIEPPGKRDANGEPIVNGLYDFK